MILNNGSLILNLQNAFPIGTPVFNYEDGLDNTIKYFKEIENIFLQENYEN